jgi:mRNA interferase HigB
MLIFNRSTLAKFWRDYPDAKPHLEAWYEEAYKARWNTPHDIKTQYRNASILKNNRVVFNISGNKYRLIVETDFARHWLLIRFLGAHAEYDKIDAETYNGFETDKK